MFIFEHQTLVPNNEWRRTECRWNPENEQTGRYDSATPSPALMSDCGAHFFGVPLPTTDFAVGFVNVTSNSNYIKIVLMTKNCLNVRMISIALSFTNV